MVGRALHPAGVWHGKGREEGGAGVWWTLQASRSGACAARRPGMLPTSTHTRLAQAHANARSVGPAPESDTITVFTCSSSRMVSTSWTCIREGGECGVSRLWSRQGVEREREQERAMQACRCTLPCARPRWVALALVARNARTTLHASLTARFKSPLWPPCCGRS